MSGTLYIVATPIGNLKDITQRAVEVLSSVAVIAAEDTRRSSQLLMHLGAGKKRMLSCHKFNERARAEEVLSLLSSGKDVALVTDSGTPAVSDPGAFLVKEVLLRGGRVASVPGPSALTAAVSVSGTGEKGFVFTGFAGKKEKDIRRLVSLADASGLPVVCYDSPKRVIKTLAHLCKFGEGREVVICREMTKVHEEVLRGEARLLRASLEERPAVRGEIVLIFLPAAEASDTRHERKTS